MTPSKKLLLTKESVRVLVASDLVQVHGGAAQPTSTAVSSARGGGGNVSSAKPTSSAVHGGGGFAKPTSTALTGGHKVSSVRPGHDHGHKLSSVLGPSHRQK